MLYDWIYGCLANCSERDYVYIIEACGLVIVVLYILCENTRVSKKHYLAHIHIYLAAVNQTKEAYIFTQVPAPVPQ